MSLRGLIAVSLLLLAAPAHAEETLPKKLVGIDVEEHLGQQVALDTQFTDHAGKSVKLADYFKSGKPVLLTLNYYTCTTLCSVQLNALVRALKKLQWTAGKEFRQVTVSIDHREDQHLAAGKRNNYLESLGRGDDLDWSFLVGKEDQIAKVAGSVGFGYRYDAELNQWAHPAVIMFISPTGKITRYIYGLEMSTQDLKFALIEAGEGKVGSTVDRLILSCFHYDASSGRYGPYAVGIMRLGGGATLLILALFLGLWWRRESRRQACSTGADM